MKLATIVLALLFLVGGTAEAGLITIRSSEWLGTAGYAAERGDSGDAEFSGSTLSHTVGINGESAFATARYNLGVSGNSNPYGGDIETFVLTDDDKVYEPPFGVISWARSEYWVTIDVVGDTDLLIAGYNPHQNNTCCGFESIFSMRLFDLTTNSLIVNADSPYTTGVLLDNHRYLLHGLVEQRGVAIESDTTQSVRFLNSSVVVPEPQVLGLLILGLVGIGLRRIRRA